MKVEYIVVHGAYTPADMDVTPADLRQWHVKENGWSKVGYHRFIRRGGAVDEILTLGEPGIHTRGYNDRSLAVCLAGGMENNGWGFNYTLEQLLALEQVIKSLQRVAPGAEVVGHRDLDDRQCPGFNVKELLGCS